MTILKVIEMRCPICGTDTMRCVDVLHIVDSMRDAYGNRCEVYICSKCRLKLFILPEEVTE